MKLDRVQVSLDQLLNILGWNLPGPQVCASWEVDRTASLAMPSLIEEGQTTKVLNALAPAFQPEHQTSISEPNNAKQLVCTAHIASTFSKELGDCWSLPRESWDKM